MKRTTLLLGIATLLAACEAAGPVTDACGPWRPIRVSREDVLTVETARAILAHDLTGQRLCGWRSGQ